MKMSSGRHGTMAVRSIKHHNHSFAVHKHTHCHRTAVVTMNATMDHPQPAQQDFTAVDVVPSIRGQLSVYAVSDLHCDYPANMAWVQDLPSFKALPACHGDQPVQAATNIHGCGETWQASCCIVAGDVSDDLRVLRHTFAALKSKFDLVAFVPGNHELWLKAESGMAPQQKPHQSYLHSDDAGASRTVSIPARHDPTTGNGGSSSSSTACEHCSSGNQDQQTSSNAQAAVSTDSRNGAAEDSVQKLLKVLQLCDQCGIIRQPALLGRLLLAPLLSWHHQSFDKEPEFAGVPRAGRMTIADYAACTWPEGFPGADQLGSEATASWFDDLNSSDIQQPGWTLLQQIMACRGTQHSSSRTDRSMSPDDHLNNSTGGAADACSTPQLHTLPSENHAAKSTISSNMDGVDVITFSHFLPHQHLLPEKRMLAYPNLAKAVGSDFLWRRLRQLQPHLHIFGHSHFAWDTVLEGVRFLQAPLCYPAERQHRIRSIQLSAKHEQQQAHASIPGHSDQRSSKQQQPLAAAAAAASTIRLQQSLGLRAKSQQQEEQEEQEESHPLRHEQPQHTRQARRASAASWLPVLVYQAAFTAELEQLRSPKDQASLNSSAVQQEEQQQQEDQQQQQQETTDVVSAAGKHGHPCRTSAVQSGSLKGSSSSSRASRDVLGCPASQSSSYLPKNSAGACNDPPQYQSEYLSGGQGTSGISCSRGMLSLGGAPLLDPGHVELVPLQWCTQVYRITSWRSLWAQPLTGLWSEHYKEHDRDPANVQLAPWVAKRYKRLKQHQATSR